MVMNIKNIVFLISFLSLGLNGLAQSNILNAKKVEDIGKKSDAQLALDNDKPLEYGYVDDRDILMSKMTWEIIDLNEKINFPLLYPLDKNLGSDRRSLINVLLDGLRNHEYDAIYNDSYFKEPLIVDDVNNLFKQRFLKATEESCQAFDALGYAVNSKYSPSNLSEEDVKELKELLHSDDYFDHKEYTSRDIIQYRIKGLWYFDKRQSELKYRLLGICPVVEGFTPENCSDLNNKNKSDQDSENDGQSVNVGDPDLIELFWVFFPDAREVLHHATAFNDKNSSKPITFDQILNARRFNGLIYKEENVYGDRQIGKHDQEDSRGGYVNDNALNQLLEAERIKEKIRNFESDMWQN